MSPERGDDDRVVIVGGGLSGLVTAYELQRRGIRSLLLEAEDHVGGRVRSTMFADGVTVDAYLEEIWETSPAYELCRRLDVPLIERPPLLRPPRNETARRPACFGLHTDGCWWPAT